MIKLFNQLKEWTDGKKAYGALIMALIPPGTAIVHDFQANASIFQILSSTEWNAFMLAAGAIFIRMGIAKTDAKVDAALGPEVK